MNDVIRELHLEIQTVEKLSAENFKRIKEDSAKALDIELTAHDQKMYHLTMDEENIKSELRKLRDTHWDQENLSRRVRYYL